MRIARQNIIIEDSVKNKQNAINTLENAYSNSSKALDLISNELDKRKSELSILETKIKLSDTLSGMSEICGINADENGFEEASKEIENSLNINIAKSQIDVQEGLDDVDAEGYINSLK